MQAETREEKLLTAISDGEKSGIVPYTRKEKFLSYIAGETDEKPTPITRIEMFLDKIERGGGGGGGTSDKFKQMVDGTITEVTAADLGGITKISDYAFYKFQSIESIEIPNSVTSIGKYAFYSCTGLKSIVIPDSAMSIGDYAFYSCTGLKSIVIPDSVMSIGLSAFHSCSGMRYYDFTARTSVPALKSTNAFSGIPSDCQMLIPAALYDEWSAATNWATYAKYMVAV